MSRPVPRSDQEIREILRQQPKRTRTSCDPCRTRKVKCDRCSPCENCSKRGYPELCSFAGPRRLINNDASSSPKRVRVDADPPGSGVVSVQAEDQGDPSQPEHFLGTDSIPAFLRDESSQVGYIHHSPNHTVEDGILPILGLNKPKSTYPFLPESDSSIGRLHSELHEMLPADHEIISIFRCYKLSSHAFTPILPDIEEFEAELCQFLEERASRKRQSSSSEALKGPKHISWVGTLFAILASGEQHSHDSFKERRIKSQLYARGSFQCLRVANFLVRPTLLCIQTLLILGNVLRNDLKPEAAWMLLGTTARMAQSLGLHQDQIDKIPPRSALWKSVVWQDSLLSLCFDRPPITTPARFDLEPADGISYEDSMHFLCDRILRSIRSRETDRVPDFAAIADDVFKIEDIHRKSLANNETASRLGIRQRSEASALNLHVNFVIAWLCRPALRNRRTQEHRSEIQLTLSEKCNRSLLECVRAFVCLHSLSNLTTRSWPIVHNGLSSALLLALLGTVNADPEVRQLQGEILEIFASESENENQLEVDSGCSSELSAPHSRALALLRTLYNSPTIDPGAPDSISRGATTPGSQFRPTSYARNTVQDKFLGPDTLDLPGLNASAFQDFLDILPFEGFESITWDPFNAEDPSNYNFSDTEPWIF